MGAKRDIPTSYAEANALLGTRESLNICNNTRLERNGYRGGRPVALRLHNTLVVTWYEDGSTELRTGGWNTLTTRDRINRALHGTDWRVGTERGALHLYRIINPVDGLALAEWERYLWPHHGTATLRADGTTDATPKPKRTHRPHVNPSCACAACVAKREGWRGIARMQGRATYEYEPAHPEEHYGADLADGAACRAMATALAAIQRERKDKVTA